MLGKGLEDSRVVSARAIRSCLTQLMQEALENDLRLCALHLRIAILELDDVINQAGDTPSAS